MLYDDGCMTFHHVLTPAEMRRAEQLAFDRGVPGILLMEHAATAVVDELEKSLGGACRNKRALFLCGPGNNGGDGLAAARLFAMRGGVATVYLTDDPKTPDARTNLAWAREMGIDIVNIGQSPQDVFGASGFRLCFDAFVDALLGTGLRDAPAENIARLIRAANSDGADFHVPIIAVDIPSGMDGETGAVPGACVRASVTVTLHAPKRGLYLTHRRAWTGKIVIADIGLWDMAYAMDSLEAARGPVRCAVCTPRALCHLPRRGIADHKGDCGRILIYAGSEGMAGAAAMCAKAAVTAGAGLTTVACPRDIMPVLQSAVPNAMCRDILDAVKGVPDYDVLALGCGLGQSEAAWQNILKLWTPQKPSVWDADALNLLARHPMKLDKNAVMTPHIGEAARLLACPAEEILADRLGAAQRLSEKYGCTAVLKSDVTVIAGADGEGRPAAWLNVIGTPALAKGGSGDALAGILAALYAVTASPLDAAARACLWHGMAGLVGEERFGRMELTTDQLIACLYDARRWGQGDVPAPSCWRG